MYATYLRSFIYYILGCIGFFNWGNLYGHSLAGSAIDRDGNNVYERFPDLLSAQLSCINHGSGCGGITKSRGFYFLRAGSTFIVTLAHEHAYIKPTDPCKGKFRYNFIFQFLRTYGTIAQKNVP